MDLYNLLSYSNQFRHYHWFLRYFVYSYKEKLEGCIKSFNLLVDNNQKANMTYSNEIGKKTEKNCKDMIEMKKIK